jgi:hypothetical protein
MNKDDKEKIESWRNHIDSKFSDSKEIYLYLFETLENFFYRYLETTQTKNLKVTTFSSHLYGAESVETNMLEALKIKHPDSKRVLIDLAKKVPKDQNPQAYFSLKVMVEKLEHDSGKIFIYSEVRGLHTFQKKIIFEYQNFETYRKELANKLEEACEIFL